MGLTPAKEMLLARLNDSARAAHEALTELNTKKGKALPPAPVLLTEKDIEYPKWLYRGWKLSSKGKGHHEAEDAKLAQNADEVKELLAQGYSEEPPKPVAKK